jgi:glycosyltransferase involved in cell wall biosynthesis
MIQIFILTHNRPDKLVHSIDSVLKQEVVKCNYEIIVSDNSTNNETEKLIQERYGTVSQLRYRRRSPMTSIDHFNTVLLEITADFFMLFHDDDTMFPKMVETLYNEMIKDDKLLATGSNAKLIQNEKVLRNFFNKSTDVNIENVDELVTAYLDYYHAPFPSYMYRKYVAENIRFDVKKGGKYCDVSFLLDISTNGAIKMLKEPLMRYFLHEGQDSASHICEQQEQLILYLAKVSSFTKDSTLIMKHRIINFYIKVSRLEKPISKSRWKKIHGIFFKYSPFYLLPRIIVKRILKLV